MQYVNVYRWGPNYTEKDYEHELKDDQRTEDYGSAQYEVLEYWGIMDAEYAREVGMEIPDEVDDLDEVQVNAWISNGKLLRVWLIHSLLTGFRTMPFLTSVTLFFLGIGVAENMDDFSK